MALRSALLEILKEILQIEMKECCSNIKAYKKIKLTGKSKWLTNKEYVILVHKSILILVRS